jgi:hypothetical protein
MKRKVDKNEKIKINLDLDKKFHKSFCRIFSLVVGKIDTIKTI